MELPVRLDADLNEFGERTNVEDFDGLARVEQSVVIEWANCLRKYSFWLQT